MLLAAAWLMFASGQAEAAETSILKPPTSLVCVAPLPPPSVRPSLPPIPKLPSCVNEAKGTHTCRHGELDRYNTAMRQRNDAMDRFISATNAYTQLLNQYTFAASEYARCELREIRKADN
jgi:hypothetical protein